MTRLAVATALCALAYLALSNAEAQDVEPPPTFFTHQACQDCLVMGVPYFAPKP